MLSFNNTINQQYQQIAQQFVKTFYEKMTSGVNIAFELFNHDVLCTIDSEEFTGSYNWLLKMTKAGILKFEYSNLSGICQPLSNFEILVTVQGTFRAINFWGQNMKNWVHFNETFILEKNGHLYSIRNYILKTK